MPAGSRINFHERKKHEICKPHFKTSMNLHGSVSRNKSLNLTQKLPKERQHFTKRIILSVRNYFNNFFVLIITELSIQTNYGEGASWVN